MELGPKMQACSERERAFVMHYLAICAEGGRANATEAARRAGYTDTGDAGIRVRGHQLLHRDRVKAAMVEVGRTEFLGLLFPTIMAARHLIENKDHPDHAGMVKSTLSALGLGERTAVDFNVSGEVTVNHIDAAIDDLRRLTEMGAPREKLVEVFGVSGLERYERMLASKAKVIEHRPEGGE